MWPIIFLLRDQNLNISELGFHGIWCVYYCVISFSRNSLMFYCLLTFAGLPWGLHTSRHQNMSGSAKTQPPGCCPAVTTRGRCVTTVRRSPSSLHRTYGVSECCWITIWDLCHSMTPLVLCICTHSTSASLSQSAPCSTCGTDVWQSSVDCPSQITWRIQTTTTDKTFLLDHFCKRKPDIQCF